MITVIQADLENQQHCEDILYLTNTYAQDPMGGGKDLSDYVKDHLIEGLRDFPTSMIFIAYEGDQPVGIANCFIGFTTFYAKKLLNIHDLAVIPDARGKGIGKRLLDAVEEKAKELGCAKLTLEVLEENPAKRLYERFGFEVDYLFMNKVIE